MPPPRQKLLPVLGYEQRKRHECHDKAEGIFGQKMVIEAELEVRERVQALIQHINEASHRFLYQLASVRERPLVIQCVDFYQVVIDYLRCRPYEGDNIFYSNSIKQI